ncbi:pyrroline-5-carboxylate reductase family protein, partial [Paenibacillus validus]|nr:pyrroline-5-carboxylate reductase dimerization domain-containing protein [Paenibacillus validus]
VETTGEEPAELRRKVTSPNGTTQAALELMAGRGFSETVTQAVLRSAERASEIGAAISDSVTSQNK